MKVFFMLRHGHPLLPGLLVGLSLDRNPRNHVPELHHSRFLGNDGHTVGIPRCDLVTLANL